jgi:lipoprotein-anchoring transpeptidase ErfK/SrfK
VIEGKGWLKDTEATFDLKVGHPNEDENILRFTRELDSSINLLDPLFYGEKRIIVKLSTQTMQIKVGDLVIKNFQVSSGKPKTPTPPGNYKILLKQDVRVAGEYPHYIMPRFMMFRKGGYGIHSLPSLANDHGVFWTEALNHIGQARSHGCVRLLPDASEFAYNFADVGTSVDVIW